MRILIAHESLAGAGGVESYLGHIIPALAARGHQLAILHHNTRTEPGATRLPHEGLPLFGVVDEGLSQAVTRLEAWQPDVCFSHNMGELDVECALTERWPTVKMMHGYFGTCISSQKAHGFPRVIPCDRALGPACLAIYMPRRCGQRRPAAMIGGYRWASRQRRLLARYARIVVASRHMAREYARNGVPAGSLEVAPLFPTAPGSAGPRVVPASPVVLFAGRMTPLKGGDVLIAAIATLQQRLRTPVRLVMAGEGPERAAWEAMARRAAVGAEFTGWIPPEQLATHVREASVLAVPSLWPEPFGLVGLEAAVHGVPAVAFAVGGIGEWLRDGVNGLLVREIGSAAHLAEALASVVENPARLERLGDAARQVAAEFSLPAHVERIEGAFTHAVARGTA